MASLDSHALVPDLGFLELTGADREGQRLCNSLTGEEVQLQGGGWLLSFSPDGWGYVTDGIQSIWAQDILQISVHDCYGQWFQAQSGARTWLDHKLATQDVVYLDLPICIDKQLVPIKIKRVWTYAAGFNIWWSIKDVQPYICSASKWSRSCRHLPTTFVLCVHVCMWVYASFVS